MMFQQNITAQKTAKQSFAMLIASPNVARLTADLASERPASNNSKAYDPMDPVVMWRAVAFGSCALFWFAVIKFLL